MSWERGSLREADARRCEGEHPPKRVKALLVLFFNGLLLPPLRPSPETDARDAENGPDGEGDGFGDGTCHAEPVDAEQDFPAMLSTKPVFEGRFPQPRLRLGVETGATDEIDVRQKGGDT